MKQILIVDDSKTARMMLKHWLTALRPKYQLHEAAGGDEALALVQASPGDWLALIDYNMEGLTGTELVQALLPHIPPACMALCTANIQGAIQEKAQDLGIHFMKKPMNPKKLMTLLGLMEGAGA